MALLVIPLIALGIWLVMIGGSLVVATAGAMFFEQGFWDGFHEAWSQPGYLALFAFIFLPILRGLTGVGLTSDSK